MARAKKCATRGCEHEATDMDRDGNLLDEEMWDVLCLGCYEADRAGDMADREYGRVRDERAVRA